MSEVKLCKDCRYINDSGCWCIHPSLPINLVSGRIKASPAYMMREHDNMCGEEGKLFEKKNSFIVATPFGLVDVRADSSLSNTNPKWWKFWK